jgi:hypothetical protein
MEKARVGPAAQLSAVIIRACQCGAKREFGKPCAECGNQDPPEALDLGVIAATRMTRWGRLKWNLWGFRAAQRRIRKANKQMTSAA